MGRLRYEHTLLPLLGYVLGGEGRGELSNPCWLACGPVRSRLSLSIEPERDIRWNRPDGLPCPARSALPFERAGNR